MNGELHILHIFEVALQVLFDVAKLLVNLRHNLLQRGELLCTGGLVDVLSLSPPARTLQGDLLGGTDTCYNVLTLCVYEVLTVEDVLTGSSVT